MAVYIVAEIEAEAYPDKTRNVKIGISSKLPARLASLQNGSARRLELLATCGGSRALEHDIHNHFKTYRVHGEWFRLSEDQLQELLSFVEAQAPADHQELYPHWTGQIAHPDSALLKQPVGRKLLRKRADEMREEICRALDAGFDPSIIAEHFQVSERGVQILAESRLSFARLIDRAKQQELENTA